MLTLSFETKKLNIKLFNACICTYTENYYRLNRHHYLDLILFNNIVFEKKNIRNVYSMWYRILALIVKPICIMFQTCFQSFTYEMFNTYYLCFWSRAFIACLYVTRKKQRSGVHITEYTKKKKETCPTVRQYARCCGCFSQMLKTPTINKHRQYAIRLMPRWHYQGNIATLTFCDKERDPSLSWGNYCVILG